MKCTATVTEPRRWEGDHTFTCGAEASWQGDIGGGCFTARCERHRPQPVDDRDEDEGLGFAIAIGAALAVRMICRAAIVVALLAVILAAVTYGWGW